MMGGAPLRYANDFARLAEQLLAERDEQHALERIVELAVETIDPCDLCSITLRTANGETTTAAASGPIATEAADLQDELGEGPCLEVTWHLETLNITDMHTETRWPRWAAAALRLGINSMLGLRLDGAHQSQVASLNLFAKQPNAFDSTDLAIASVFARHAAAGLAVARAEDGLRVAARSRQTIGVAQGMLMQRFGLTLDQSFELLRRYSQTNNIKLRTLVDRLLEAGRIPDSGEGDPGSDLEETLGLTGQND